MALTLYMAPSDVQTRLYAGQGLGDLLKGKLPFVISMKKPLGRCLLSEKRRLEEGATIRENIAYSDASGPLCYVHGNIVVDFENGLSYFAKEGSRDFVECADVAGPRDYDKMVSSALFFDFDGKLEEFKESYRRLGFHFPVKG